MKWEPIETVPKDGTVILAWDGRCVILAWSLEFKSWSVVDDNDYFGGNYEPAPTHWMHLPEGPT